MEAVKVAPRYPRSTSIDSWRSSRSGVIERSAGQVGLTAW